MLKQSRFFILLTLLSFAAYLSVEGMVFDNRFFPLIQKPFLPNAYPIEASSHWAIRPFYFFSHTAFDHPDIDDNDEFGLFEINGTYDQLGIDRALRKAGITDHSLLRSDFRIRNSLPWRQCGRREAWGFELAYYQWLTNWFGFGFDWLFIHVSSRLELLLNLDAVQGSVAENRELLAVNSQMHKLMGVSPGLWNKNSSGDLDLYIRFGTIYDYVLKMRRIQVGLKLGALIPAAPEFDIYNPASVPVGGNKHWGIYGALDAEFTLKQNWKAGLMLRLSKRFARTTRIRIPILHEPLNYAVLVDTARVNPGLTFVFSPYIQVEGLREGLGARALYTLIKHNRDRIRSVSTDNTLSGNIQDVVQRSKWGIQYVTLTVFYDVGKSREFRGALPVISCDLDIPLGGIVSERSSKTFGVSLRIESDLW
jgi:hypothetical protein